MLYSFRAVGNGLRTDHPIPDLPFVDDAHLPLDDPHALEAVGRRHGTDTWGRQDKCPDGGWGAFTTDPLRHELAWCVRWHPVHARSVVLYRDTDVASVHMAHWGPALLFRSGGYRWDGITWYRPSQVWDSASEEYVARPVPVAATVTAADLLDPADYATPGVGDRALAGVLQVGQVDLAAQPAADWVEHLAAWAAARQPKDKPLNSCVVAISAPELTGEQLVGVSELAEIAGIAASTLRAYLARDEGDVPPPQATVNGRSVWARPVAQEWAEARRRSPEGIRAAVATNKSTTSLPEGVTETWQRFTRTFFSRLWENPAQRKRWALRWRNEAAACGLAEELSWEVAANLDSLVPLDALSSTVRHAVLDEFATGQQLDRDLDRGRHRDQNRHLSVVGATAEDCDLSSGTVFYGISSPVARMLDWLIRHSPTAAGHTIGEIIGEAHRSLGIPHEVSEHSLRTALVLDSKTCPQCT